MIKLIKWQGSILGFISAALCYFATKPKTNRIPIMRAHMAMAFINVVVAAVALTVILGAVLS